MPKIYLDYSDGRYFTRQLTDAEAAEYAVLNMDVANVADDVWATYCRDCERDGIWQALWRSISNEQSMLRRERELMPLEDAAREIARLKVDLERSQRMEKFYEQEHKQLLHDRHRAAHAAFTCVFPLPGCDVSALPPTWREDAQDILDYYDEPHVDRTQIQACCCGLKHEKLDEATIQRLRLKGFVLEHSTEGSP